MKRFSRLFLETYTHTTIGGESFPGALSEVAWIPHVDIYEQPDAILVVAEIPGLSRESIRIDVADGVLRVSGVRPKMIPEDTLRVHQIEIPYGPFVRDVQLPHWADMERSEASYEEGCLKVRIPRKASP